MRHRTAPIRMWASAALGAALLGTSVFTGVSAANAASAGSSAQLVLTPGTTGGSGTAIYRVIANTVLAFDDPKCNASFPVDGAATVSVTIGATQHVSSPLSGWVASTSVRDVTGCSASGVWNPTAKGTITTTHKTWTFDYSCVPAGTAAVVSSQKIPLAPNAVIPDNGPLPESCAGPAPVPTPPAPKQTPSAAFSTASGAVGSTFVIRGSGFGPGDVVYGKFDTHGIGQASAGDDGTFLLSLTVPAWAAPGEHLVTIGSASNPFFENVPFTVTAPSSGPAITLTPASGAPGAAFTVDGVGYGPSESVQVIFGSTTLQILNADADGHFSYRGTVPKDAAPGARAVSAASENVGARAATFTVTGFTPAPQPAPSVSTAKLSAGKHFTVSGSHYAPGETVTVEFHSTPTLLGTATVGADGTFSLPVTVPADAPAGSHTVTITAASTGTQSIPFTVAAATAPSSSPSPSPAGNTSATTGSSSGSSGSGTGTLVLNGSDSTTTPAAGTPGAAAQQSGTTVPAGTGNAGRGLAVQTAVDATAGAGGNQAALTLWSAVTGILGLGCAAAATVLFRRVRRAS